MYLAHMFKLSDLIPFDHDFPVWRIEEADFSSMMLYKCAEDLYWVIQQGKLPSVFCSRLFIIVNEELLQFLVKHVGEQLEHYPVTIYDRPSDSNIPGYYRLCANTTADFEELREVQHDGNKIWIKDGSGIIFISRELQKTISQNSLTGIECIPGLAGMG